MYSGRHTVIFTLFVFLFIAITHSAPTGGVNKGVQRHLETIVLTTQQAHNRRLDELTLHDNIVEPMEKQRMKMNRKWKIDPTRLIDKYQIKKQERKAELHNHNYNHLTTIVNNGGGQVVLDQSKSGKRLSFTAVDPSVPANGAS